MEKYQVYKKVTSFLPLKMYQYLDILKNLAYRVDFFFYRQFIASCMKQIFIAKYSYLINYIM